MHASRSTVCPANVPGLYPMVRYVRTSGGHIEFSAPALVSLAQTRQIDDVSPEGGGVLLGRLVVNTDDVVIDEITFPGPEDVRARYSFRRSPNSAQPRVVSAWQESTGTKIYLGDWHSHPEDHPNPSWVDRRDWNRVLKRAVYEQAFLLFVIVGRRSIHLWEGRRVGTRSTALEPCPEVVDEA
jgi:integrative and conjugative element protein (TIGR02256 family)